MWLVLLLRLKTWRKLSRKFFTDPRPGLSTRSSRARTRVNEKTINRLIPQTLYISVTDVERLIKCQTASTKKAKSHFYDTKRHFRSCRKKRWQQQENCSQSFVKRIPKVELVKTILGDDTSRLVVSITIQDRLFMMVLDTATMGNFISLPVWKQQENWNWIMSDIVRSLPASFLCWKLLWMKPDPRTGKQNSIHYIITKISGLNLLGQNAIQTLGISVDNALGLRCIKSQKMSEGAKTAHLKTFDKPYVSLQQHCHNLCDEFPDLCKEGLGCPKDFKLEVKLKSDAKLVFHKAQPVPFALQDDLVTKKASPKEYGSKSNSVDACGTDSQSS